MLVCVDNFMALQCAKKVVWLPGASGFCAYIHIGLVNSVLNLSDGQVNFLGEFRLPKKMVIILVHQKNFGASYN